MNILSLLLHIFTFYSSPRNSFTFTIFALILLIFYLIIKLSERRNVVAFLNL